MGKKLSESEIIERIEKKFPGKFDFKDWNFTSIDDKVTLTCNDCGNIVYISPRSLLSSVNGCKQCYLNSKPKNLDKVIQKIKDIYGENRFDFSKFEYKNARTEVTLICNLCGSEFKVIPADLTRSRRVAEPCRNCYKKSLSKTLKDFEKDVLEKFGDKFDFCKAVYKNAKTSVLLICKDCGNEFEITPDSLLRSEFGCPHCAEESRIKKRTKTTEQFIIEAKEIHGDKYDYSKVEYISCDTPVIIICSKHGEFKQTPTNHLLGNNCPKCKTSKGECFIETLLEKYKISYISLYRISHPDFKKGIFVDFGIIYNNKLYIIEYNGILHYKPVKFFGGEEHFYNYLVPRDNALDLYCLENNICLLKIKYSLKEDEVEDLVLNFLSENGILSIK